MELTICIDEDLYSSLKKKIVSDYATAYPEVKVTYEVIERDDSTFSPLIDEDYRNTTLRQLQTEIMSGNGPDLFILDSGYLGECFFQDINKAMRSGLFCDLLPLFRDAGISEDDFIKPIFDAGKVDGKQLVAPLDYQVFDVLTNEDSLKNFGFDQISDTAGMLAGIRDAMKIPGTAVLSFLSLLDNFPNSYKFLNPYYYTTQPHVDYNAGTAQIDTPLTRDILETWKSTRDMIMASKPVETTARGYLQSNHFLYFNPYFVDVAQDAIRSTYMGVTLNMEPLPSEDGGVCAVISSFSGIRLNSENKLNAVNMLKLLLSEKYQIGKSGAGFTYPNEGYPVLKGIMDKRLTNVINQYHGLGSTYFSINPAVLPDKNLQMFVKMESEITTARFPIPKEVNDILDQYYTGGLDLDTAIRHMQAYWDKSLSE